jgi:hypothetical protein
MNATVVSDRFLHVSAIGARLIMAVGGAHCPTVLGERFPRHPAASVAHHDAPLNAERVATHGRGATESDVEHAGVPAARTGSNGGSPRGLASVSRTYSPTCVAHHDASLAGERAATRGRSAMEGGGERAVVKRASIQFEHQAGEPRRTAGASSRLAQPFYGQVQEPRFLLPT